MWRGLAQRPFILLLIFGNAALCCSSPRLSVNVRGRERRAERRAVPILYFKMGIDGLRGANAASSLLRGARPVSSHSNWYREYLKTGGDTEAVEDFYRARPAHVTDFELPGGVYVKTGEIGDRKLIVKSSSDTGMEPTLEIIKKFKIGTLTKDEYFPGNELVDKITYINTD